MTNPLTTPTMPTSVPTRTDSGTLPGGFPYASVGDGPRTLAVLPGFGDAMFSGRYPSFSGWALAPYFERYLDDYAVYLVSRPRGLPAGYDADDAAESHARALESVAGDSGTEESTGGGPETGQPGPDETGSLDVIGISMGGMIGLEVARRYPDLVDRLVLANSGCRLADDARPEVRENERDARERDWASIRSRLARALYADARSVAYPPLIRTVGRITLPRPADPADVWRALEFVLSFDGCDRLGDIERPTLVFGGERDPYFPPEIARRTADGIPDGRLTLVPGAKHGAFHERKWQFDSRVTSFLER